MNSTGEENKSHFHFTMVYSVWVQLHENKKRSELKLKDVLEIVERRRGRRRRRKSALANETMLPKISIHKCFELKFGSFSEGKWMRTKKRVPTTIFIFQLAMMTTRCGNTNQIDLFCVWTFSLSFEKEWRNGGELELAGTSRQFNRVHNVQSM